MAKVQWYIRCPARVNTSKINNILTEDMDFLIYDFIILRIGSVFLDGKCLCSGQELSHLAGNTSDSRFFICLLMKPNMFLVEKLETIKV